jgi:hypothetical protein
VQTFFSASFLLSLAIPKGIDDQLFSLCVSLLFDRIQSDDGSKLSGLVLEQQLRPTSASSHPSPPDERLVLAGREWTVLDRALGAQCSPLRLVCSRSCLPQHGTVRQPASVTPTVWSQFKVSTDSTARNAQVS